LFVLRFRNIYFKIAGHLKMPAVTRNKKPKGADHDIDSLMKKMDLLHVRVMMKIVVTMLMN